MSEVDPEATGDAREVAPSNSVRAAMGPGEIVVDFGQRVSRAGEGGPPRVALRSRVTMDPRTARRLLSGLEEALRELERRAPPGTGLDREETSGDDRSRGLEKLLDPTGHLVSSRAAPDAAAARAGELFALVRGLGVPYAHERSFRMRAGELLSNRFLLSIDMRELEDAGPARMREAFTALAMPESDRDAFAQELDAARFVHFGFEADASEPLFKVYLEYAAAIDATRRFLEADSARAAGAPALEPTSHLLYRACKWDPSNAARHVQTRYRNTPGLTAESIEERLAAIYGDGEAESFAIAREILALAGSRSDARNLRFMEVEEDDNPRRSFDLNLYPTGLTMKDLAPLLSRARRHFDVAPGRFQALLDQIKHKPAGHVAGGIHRNGAGFFNFYFGVEAHAFADARPRGITR